MAYKNYYGGSLSYRSAGSRQDYYKPFQSNRFQSQKVHSGCKMKKDYVTKHGEQKDVVIYGWKYTKKFGLMSFVASPSKHQTKSKYENMVVVINSSTGKSTMFGQWNPDKKILWFPDVKMIASPEKSYWSYIKPKNFK